MQRRELFSFLSSQLKPKAEKESYLRPPYFSDINAFDTECQKCDGKCATLCQEQIIVINSDKTPSLDFSKSGCTYCDACALACDEVFLECAVSEREEVLSKREFDVLKIEDKKMIDAEISINEKTCLSWIGVMCFSCKDPCLEDAIEFKAMFMPTIDMQKCTACGFCISRCPTLAIDVKVL
ncbi:MAG: 4Fe-4S binding protein [Campylobacterales bacterium]|nr:4Fe-4S binding protein [Campylobacterales bacterium]